jgi:predicted DCC family thiol-disulfide oxidoreductase YuxK
MKVRRVYFNSACPVCRAGIAVQRERMNTTGTGCEIEWRDITKEPDALIQRGITVDDVRRKLYVEDEQGDLCAGAEAFAALWQETPGWRWLGRRVCRLPLSNAKREHLLVLRRILQCVAGLVHEIGDVYRRKRIGAFDDEHVPLGHAAQRLSGPQRRERTFEAAEIHRFFRHRIRVLRYCFA